MQIVQRVCQLLLATRTIAVLQIIVQCATKQQMIVQSDVTYVTVWCIVCASVFVTMVWTNCLTQYNMLVRFV